jgi:hypothetical protein
VIPWCAQKVKAGFPQQLSDVRTVFISQLANRLCRRIFGFPAKHQAGGRKISQSGRQDETVDEKPGARPMSQILQRHSEYSDGSTSLRFGE